MRKIYTLLFALMAVCGFAQAQVVFTAGEDGKGLGLGEDNSAVPAEYSTTKDGVTITISNGVMDPQYRIYKGATLTVSASGSVITTIKLACTANGTTKQGPGCFAEQDGYSYEGKNGTWTGSASTVVFTASSNQVRATVIEVYLNGSTPSPVEPGIDWTSTPEKPLTVAQALEKAAKLAAQEDSGKDVYVKGKISYIAEIGTINEKTGQPYGNATYYISDNGQHDDEATTELEIYHGKGLGGADLADGDIKVGDEVVVVGVIKNYVNKEGKSTLEFNTGSKIYALNGKTDDGGNEPEPEPQPQIDYNVQGEGTLANPYNIDAVRSFDIQSTSETEIKEVWVKGVVLGYITSNSLSESTLRVGVPEGEEVTKSNIVLIDAAHNSAAAMPSLDYMAPVQLPSGDVRDALNLGDNSDLIGKTIWVCGDALKYMGVSGLRNIKKYSLDGTNILPDEGDEPTPEPTPTPVDGATGNGTLEDPYNFIAATKVATALEASSKTEDVYVKGKISEIKYTFDAQHGTATFFITDNGEKADNQFQIYSTYYLGNRAWVEGDTQVAVGDEVVIYGKLTLYKGTPETSAKESYIYSLNGVTDGGETPVPQYLELPSIARAKAAAVNAGNGIDAVFKANDLLVTYVNGKSAYVFDGTDGLLLYANDAATNAVIKAGDKVTADFKGQLKVYNGLTEIAVASIENLTVSSSNNAVTPQEVTIADITNNYADYESELVTIKELAPAAEAWANRNITFTDDSDNEVVVRDNWNVAANLTFDTTKSYGITGFVAMYANASGSTVQLYPRTAEDIDGDTEVIVVPDPRDAPIDNPYSVEELRALAASSTNENLQEDVWVVGYIVGYINGSSLSETTAIFSAEAPAEAEVAISNILIADAAGTSDVAAVAPIQLQNNAPARTDLNLRDNADKLGVKVWLNGNVRKYMGVTGLRDVKNYSLDGVNTTAIQGVAADEAADGAIYTVAGQRVQAVAKSGLYIVGGKKVLVK